jgi:DNA invertase Pin-like site-specific DNA recombinase
VFHFLAALAEYDREMIVEGTMDGLASARARGRVGGRPPALSQRQLDTTLTISLGGHRPHVRGKIREYVAL